MLSVFASVKHFFPQGLLLAVKAGGLLGLAAAAATRGAANRRRGKRSVATEEEIGEQGEGHSSLDNDYLR